MRALARRGQHAEQLCLPAAAALAEGRLRGRAHRLRRAGHAGRPPVPQRPLGGHRGARLRTRRAPPGQTARQARRARRPLAGRSVRAVGGVAGPRYARDLKVRGTVAFAPVSHLAEQAALLPSLTSPSALSGLASMILRGIDIARPSLDVGSALSDRAAALYPQTLSECLGKLASSSSFGALAPADLIRHGTDLGPAIAALSKLDDPEDVRIRTPVEIHQGTADATVFKAFTDPLVSGYKKRGIKVIYKTYEGVTHGGAVTDAHSATDATRYIRSRLG